MKKKYCLSLFAFSLFSIAALAQSENKKADTITPARQVILNKTGEKKLAQELKEKQLAEQPAVLKKDSVNIASTTIPKHKKSKRCSNNKRK